MKRWSNNKKIRRGCWVAIGLLLLVSTWAQTVWRTHQERGQAALQSDTIPLPLPLPGMWIEGRDTLLLPSDSTGMPLTHFFAGLDSLKSGKDTVITVVHLGDSHIQAGRYSGKVMRLLHREFGNAGRGWIAPYKLNRTNEPDDYFIRSAIRDWTGGRITQRRKKTAIGMGGIGVRSFSPSINLNVIVTPKNGAGYAFNQAILYRRDQAMPMLPTDKSKPIAEAFLADSAYAGVKADTFRLKCFTDTLLLHSTRRKQGTDQLLPASSFNNTYYGFSLMNGQAGILYHSVGVNGAMYVNYTDSDYVARLALLRPQLLIVSLGTNETFGRRFSGIEFSEQVKRFLRLVKHEMPHVEILLTTPPECYKRTYVKKKRVYVRNENTEKAAAALRQIAKEEGLACWDLFAATGGKLSCRKWLDQRLMARDRIHFTQKGYEDQGVLLYRALMNAYNQHVKEKQNRIQSKENNGK